MGFLFSRAKGYGSGGSSGSAAYGGSYGGVSTPSLSVDLTVPAGERPKEAVMPDLSGYAESERRRRAAGGVRGTFGFGGSQ